MIHTIADGSMKLLDFVAIVYLSMPVEAIGALLSWKQNSLIQRGPQASLSP